ncbi:MAG: hypothetical protein FWF02_02250 [Micrococcales bacterium]|nr:hypothetical protein [Micrococcales bacterium]MCL2666513.1 hypothetical protein [Micrococcales bacterium]
MGTAADRAEEARQLAMRRRAWWDTAPQRRDPQLPILRRPTMQDLRHDRRVQLIAAGVVAVLVVTVVGVVRWVRHEPAVPATAGQAKSASQAAVGYLTALAEGDADAVLAYMATPPPSTTFITDDVLAVSAGLNPITDIVVLESDEYDDRTTAVTVQYRIGPTRVLDTYHMVKHGRSWRLSVDDYQGTSGFVEMTLPAEADGVGLTVNGVPAGPDLKIYLVPGTYQLGTTNPLLSIDDTVVLTALSQHSGHYDVPSLAAARLGDLMTLTPLGRQTVTEAVAAAAAQCLAEKTVVTSCNLAVPAHYHPTSVQMEGWIVEADAVDLAQTTPDVGWGRPYLACVDEPPTTVWATWSASPYDPFDVLGRMRRNGQVTDYRTGLYSYAVDLADPDHLVVHLNWLGSAVTCRDVESP